MITYFAKTMKNGRSCWRKQWEDQIFMPRYIADMEKSRIHYSGKVLFSTEVEEYQFSRETVQYWDGTLQIIIRLSEPAVGLAYSGGLPLSLPVFPPLWTVQVSVRSWNRNRPHCLKKRMSISHGNGKSGSEESKVFLQTKKLKHRHQEVAREGLLWPEIRNLQ